MTGKLLTIMPLCLASFLMGRLTTSRSASEIDETDNAPHNSSLLKRNKSILTKTRALLDAAPTHERHLDVRQAVRQMNAVELDTLWKSHQGTLDYHNPDDAQLAADILRQLAKLDPRAALAKIPDTGGAKYPMLVAVYEGWAETDPEGALSQIRQETDKRARHGCLTAIIEQIGREDRHAATKLFSDSVADKTLTWNAWDKMSAFFNDWARESPAEALSSALKLNAATRAVDGLWGGIRGWARSDGTTAAAWIAANLPDNLQREGTIQLVQSWANTNPKQAADFMLGKHDSDEKHKIDRWSHTIFGQGMWNVLHSWADSSFSDAAKWVDAVEDPQLKSELHKSILAMTDDREAALEYALERINDPVMLDAVISRSESFARAGDATAGLAWAKENLKAPEHFEKFERELIDGLLRWRPSEAIEYLDDLPSGTAKTDSYQTAAEHWGRAEPENVKAWLDKLPPGEERDAATLGLAEGWLDNDLETAEKWIASIPSDNLRDQLTDRHARARMHVKDIDRSIEIAQQIHDPHLREQTMESILYTWFIDEAKAVAARNYIRETDLISENVRWRLLNRRVAK